MKNFFNKLIASVSSIDYYKSVLYQPFSEVAIFYALFLVLVSGLLTIQYWTSTMPKYMKWVDQTSQEVSSNYPNNLILSWTGQTLSSSHDPLFVPFPQILPQKIKDVAEYVIIITSQDPPTPTVSSLFITSPTNIYSVDEGSISEPRALKDVLGEESFQVTKANLPSYLERAEEFTKTAISTVGYFFPLIMFLFLLLTNLYILIIDTFIIFLFIKIQRISLGYRQLLQLGMALLVPAQIIDLVVKLAQLDLPVSMLSLSFWILFIVVFFSLQRKVSI